jgi:hypothetical protein
MAKAMGISLSSLQRTWRDHQLQPHRLRTLKHSRERGFAAKLTDIVGLYVDRRPTLWCFRSMKRARSKRSTAPSPDFRASPDAA